MPEADQHARAKAAFQQLPEKHKALLILDNLNEENAGIVGRVNRETALPAAEKVHLLITTRAEPRSLGGMETVALDTLPPGEALDLLFRYRQFARDPADAEYLQARKGLGEPEASATGVSALTELDKLPADQEWKVALAIVHRLGRHTLAVTLVGAYLGSYPDMSYGQYALDLAAHGIGLALDAASNDDKVKNLIQHPETLIGPLFERSVARLSPLALRTLEYAAFLPPNLEPLGWLKQLITQDVEMADALKSKSFQPPPWAETIRTLEGLQYLIGQPYARMHRVVQEVVYRRMSEDRLQREQAVLSFIENRTAAVCDSLGTYSDLEEVAAVEQFVRARSDHPERLVGRTSMWLIEPLRELGRLQNAIDMAGIANRILKEVLFADPASTVKQRDLANSFSKLGEVNWAAGNPTVARDYYEQSLAIVRTLDDAAPISVHKQRDLSVLLMALGDLRMVAIDEHAARDYYEQALAIHRTLANADPTSALKQRDLSISFNKLGDVSVSAGELAAARDYYEQSLAIRRTLADADPTSALKQRDLSISFHKLGDVSVSAGDLAAARAYYEQGLAICRTLADADPASALKKGDLSGSIESLGDVSVAAGDLAAARAYYEQGLAIRRTLADADPASALKQRALAVLHLRLIDVEKNLGDRPAARTHLAAYVAIIGTLVAEGRNPRPFDRVGLRKYQQQLDEWAD